MNLRIIFLLTALLGCFSAQAVPGLALVTILDGEAWMLRDGSKLALAEGVKLQADDILQVPEQQGRLLRIEFADGLSLAFGPGTLAQLAPRLPGERGKARAYLLRGWAKVTVSAKSGPASLVAPAFDARGIGANAVFAVLPNSSQAFSETGDLSFKPVAAGSAAVPMKTGNWIDMAGSAKPVLAQRPSSAFIQQVPKPFLDALPSRAALFAGKEKDAKPLSELSYADAQPWLDGEPMLRRAAITRWKALARKPEFKSALIANLKAHPEWEPVLFPPPPVAPAARLAPSSAYK
jgi:hypothetical protein